jgi:hypothetical protein
VSVKKDGATFATGELIAGHVMAVRHLEFFGLAIAVNLSSRVPLITRPGKSQEVKDCGALAISSNSLASNCIRLAVRRSEQSFAMDLTCAAIERKQSRRFIESSFSFY